MANVCPGVSVRGTVAVQVWGLGGETRAVRVTVGE